MSAEGLGSAPGKLPDFDDTKFTGNFVVDEESAGELYGPYGDPQLNDSTVLVEPMKNALGIEPKYGEQLQLSGLCGTCHVIRVPVLKKEINGMIPMACMDGPTRIGEHPADFLGVCLGQPVNTPCSVDGKNGTCQKYFTFEQTTYFEFRNSVFSDPNTPTENKTCQNCHMPRYIHNEFTNQNDQLSFKIANIEEGKGTGWPLTTNRLADSEINLTERVPYGRHTLYGLNIFLNQMAQQFPILLGLRQIDFFGQGIPAFFTAREFVLHQARELTATIEVGPPLLVDTTLTVEVTVQNMTGHKFPSGVGFRRHFIEFVVCKDDTCATEEQYIWASGLTNELGVIQDGTTDVTLASEFFCDAVNSTDPPCPIDLTSPGCPGVFPTVLGVNHAQQCYQPHHQVITREDEVQIYEAVAADCDDKITTSVTHLCQDVKDNRLQPKGWKTGGKYYTFTLPGPGASQDTDYQSMGPGTPLTGADKIKYQIELGPDAANAKSVRAKLYYQSIPPSFMKDRFDGAFLGAGKKDDIERFYYMTSKLNVDAKDSDGNTFIEDWKLQIGETAMAMVLPVPTGACCNDAEGICTVTTGNECQVPGLRYGGDGSDCNTIDPPCGLRGACCNDAEGFCTITLEIDCQLIGLRYGGDGSDCGSIDPRCGPIPTVSGWGLVVLALILMVGAKLYFGRRETDVA